MENIMNNSRLTNNAYVVFHMGDHIYTATITNFDSLVGWLVSSSNKPIACLGVEFTRGSSFFKRQIKSVLKSAFNKRVKELTSDERVDVSAMYQPTLDI